MCHSSVNAKLLAACEAFFLLPNWEHRLSPWKDIDQGIRLLEAASKNARYQAEDDMMPVDEAWLLSIGFRATNETGILRYPIKSAFNGDPQWIEADFDEWPTFALHRTCDVYEERNTPPDAVFFDPKTRGDVRRLLKALGINKE